MTRHHISIKIGDFAPTQSTRTLTKEGFLLCKGAKLAKAPQVRTYYPEEFGGIQGKADGSAMGVYTAADELFSADTIASFEGRELTNNHPPNNQINAENWQKYHIGNVSNVRMDGDYLVADLLIKDSQAVADIQNNQKLELSLGYSAELHIGDGQTQDGTAYQASFSNIKGDHVALVQYGRCGGDCRIGDSNKSPKSQGENMEKIINGIRFDIGDNTALADAIEQMNRQLEQSRQAKLTIGDKSFAVVDELTAVQAVVNQLVADGQSKDEQIKTLQANQITPEKLDQIVMDRANVIADAKKLQADVKTDGCTCEQIKRAVVSVKAGDAMVQAILGNVSVADAKPEQIDTVFRALLVTAKQATEATPANQMNVGDTATDKAAPAKTYSKQDAWKNLK